MKSPVTDLLAELEKESDRVQQQLAVQSKEQRIKIDWNSSGSVTLTAENHFRPGVTGRREACQR